MSKEELYSRIRTWLSGDELTDEEVGIMFRMIREHEYEDGKTLLEAAYLNKITLMNKGDNNERG